MPHLKYLKVLLLFVVPPAGDYERSSSIDVASLSNGIGSLSELSVKKTDKTKGF